MKKVIKVLSILVILCLVGCGIYFGVKKFTEKEKKEPRPTGQVVKVDVIEKFDYKLYENSSKLYTSLYYDLKDELKKKDEEVDEQRYAELIAQMFVSEFYSLGLRVTNQDVGGMEFVHSAIRDNFKLKSVNTLYKFVESNVYGDRKQELPIVTEFVSSNVMKRSYVIKKDKISINDPNAYTVKLSWKYDKDLGYQTSATLMMVHEKDKLVVIAIE